MKRTLAAVLVLAAVIAVLFTLYHNSVKEDFNNISHAETYRIGESFTGVYHRPDCPKVKSAGSGANLVKFEDNKDAKANHYSPCKRCAPDKD